MKLICHLMHKNDKVCQYRRVPEWLYSHPGTLSVFWING